MWNLIAAFIVWAGILGSITPLNFEAYEEGACKQYTPQKDFNQTWFVETNLPYFAAGSKNHLYRMVYRVPNHIDIEEDDFLRNVCLQGHTNGTTGIRNLFGFGLGVIGTFQAKFADEFGVIDFVNLDTPEHFLSRHTITLTDNESFVFFGNCWNDINQRGWDVLSSKPTLDEATQKLIRDHAISLGFDPAKFIFFSGEGCDGSK